MIIQRNTTTTKLTFLKGLPNIQHRVKCIGWISLFNPDNPMRGVPSLPPLADVETKSQRVMHLAWSHMSTNGEADALVWPLCCPAEDPGLSRLPGGFNVQHHMHFPPHPVSPQRASLHQSMTAYFLPKGQIIDPIMGLLQMEINVICPSIYFCFSHWNGCYGYRHHARIAVMLFLN